MKQIFMVLLLVFVSGCVPKKRQLEEPSYDVVCIDGVVYFTGEYGFPSAPKFSSTTREVVLCNQK